ncbi:MAG: hypothetical protein NZ520_11610, partial [bacterium]|nr:hypothetical protein [bacterium]
VLFLLPVDIALRRIVWQTEVLPEWQQAWGRVQERLHLRRGAPATTAATSRLLQRKERLRERYAPAETPVSPSEEIAPSTQTAAAAPPVAPSPSTPSEQIGRLLDAKRRARRRD